MKAWLSKLKEGKYSAYILLAIFAAILLFALAVYFDKEDASGTTTETRLEQIIGQIDGVGKLDLMVNEADGEILGVIIVCEGANNLSVRLDIINAVSTALGISRASIQIYEMK